MKKVLNTLRNQIFSICLLVSFCASAQDIIYFDNGDPLPNTRITDVTDEKVVLTVMRDGVPKTVPFSRSKILLAFTKAGNYLIVSELSTNLTQAKQQLEAFLSAPPRLDGNDYLIKAAPATVIPAHIGYDSEEIVNYKTSAGNAASISKSELVAIIYKDGRHVLVAQAGDAVALLAQVKPAFSGEAKLVDVQASKPEPVQQKNNVVATVPAEQPVQVNPAPVAGGTRMLTDEEKETYRQKSLLQVDKFMVYISAITDKDNSSSEKDLAIEEALKLFIDPDNTTIDVTSAKRPGIRTIALRQYLIRLKLLPYKYTKVEWLEAKFVHDLTLESDGNYYGTIAGRQTFTGFGANDKSQYYDETDKNVRVKLVSYKKIIDNTENAKWRVLLGNIKVSSE